MEQNKKQDAGKRINIVIHNKGICATADADVVRVTQELEDSVYLSIFYLYIDFINLKEEEEFASCYYLFN